MVIRVNKNSNYIAMSKSHLQRKDLSLKAKGLLSIMLSLPEDFDYSIENICSLCLEGETAVKSALKELKEAKYLVIDKSNPTKTNGGRYEYAYCIYETPQNESIIQEVEKQEVEIQGVENHPLVFKEKREEEKRQTKEENSPLINPLKEENNIVYNILYNKKEVENKRREKEVKEKENTQNAEKPKELTFTEIILEQPPKLQEPLNEFVKMRKAIKKPLTPYALRLAIKRLHTLTTSLSEAVKIVEQSITNGWQTFYLIKVDKQEEDTKKTNEYKKLLEGIVTRV